MTARGQFDLVGHNLIRYEELALGSLAKANNWIVAPENPDDEWARTLMKMIGEWRAVLRRTYIHWAMAINGLHVAAAKYRAETQPKKFTVSSVRADSGGSGHQEVIGEYTFEKAAESHLKIQPMFCAHGFIDMYAGLEEMIFALYRNFWRAKPDGLLMGPEFAHLRKMRRAAETGEETRTAWEAALDERINDWQRKKLYEGLDKVLLALCQSAGLKTPVGFKVTTLETWAESVRGVSLIRNLLIHGESIVPPELEEFCATPYDLGFDFTSGELLRLTILDLQVLENFCDQLLTGINMALVERARPSVKKDVKQQLKEEKL
jgi:hypothetical protein